MSGEQYNGIAIIGLAGRFPGAESVEEFWANLVAGKESISFFTDAELAEVVPDVAALKRRGHYVPARGTLKDAEYFDPAFFGIHPKEAEVMDPQQRVLLEAVWSAVEDAGYRPSQLAGPSTRPGADAVQPAAHRPVWVRGGGLPRSRRRAGDPRRCRRLDLDGPGPAASLSVDAPRVRDRAPRLGLAAARSARPGPPRTATGR